MDIIHSGTVGALDSKYEFEYLIKFKGLSYLHVKWMNASEIGAEYDAY